MCAPLLASLSSDAAAAAVAPDLTARLAVEDAHSAHSAHGASCFIVTFLVEIVISLVEKQSSL